MVQPLPSESAGPQTTVRASRSSCSVATCRDAPNRRAAEVSNGSPPSRCCHACYFYLKCRHAVRLVSLVTRRFTTPFGRSSLREDRLPP